MRYFSVNEKNNPLSYVVFAVLAAVLTSFAFVLPVSAVNSDVGAVVCGGNNISATVEITEPNDDSVVNQSTVELRGTVSDASQIEIRIDGNYSNTVAIGTTQTTFETQVGLTTGTHTITVIANAICQGQDGEDSIVITYEEVTEPSDGGSTPTDVDGGDGGVTVGEDAEPAETAGIQQLPVIGAAVSIISDFAAFSGLDATVPEANTVLGVSRVGLTVAALTLVVAAGTLAPLLLQFAPGVSELFNTTSARTRTYVGWILRAGGVLIMGLVYFL